MPKSKTIKTLLSADQVKYALSLCPKYEGDINENEFIITRKSILNNWRQPVIKGEIIKQKDHTGVNISFGMQRLEKTLSVLFFILLVIVSVIALILSKDVVLAAVILAFGVFCFLISLAIYKMRCYNNLITISEILKKMEK